MATVQDYLNMATSLIVSNKSGTDASYSLPNDIRKISDQKVSNIAVRTLDMAASVNDVGVSTVLNAPGAFKAGLFMVFWTHPVVIKKVGTNTLTTDMYTSAFSIYRNMAGHMRVTGAVITFDNDLDKTTSPPYNAPTATSANTTAGQYTVVEIVYEV